MLTQSQLDKQYHVDTEPSLIGSVMNNMDGFYVVASYFKAEMMFLVRHEIIWKAIVTIEEKGQDINPVTVCVELQAQGKLIEIGGPAYITECINACPSSLASTSYADIIKADYERRQVDKALVDSRKVAGDLSKPVERVKEDVLTILDNALTDTHVGYLTTFKALADKGGDRALSYKHNKQVVRGLPTGFPTLDKLWSGIQPDDFVVIASLTSAGKSTVALQIAKSLASVSQGLYMPTEMSGDQLMDRLACLELGLDYSSFLQGNILQSDAEILETYNTIGDLRVLVYNKSNPTPLEIKTYVRMLQRKRLINWLVVDGINDIWDVGELSDRTAAAATALHDIAYSGIPVIATAHANRGSTQRAYKEPNLYDIQGSIRISQLCTRFIGIHREGYESETGLSQPKKDNSDTDSTTFRIGKDRPTGKIGKVIPTKFIRGSQGYRFVEIDPNRQAPIIGNGRVNFYGNQD